MSEFLATLAHELRNPLALIRNAVQLLRLAGAAGKPVQSVAEMLERQVNPMARLVDELLDASRITRVMIELRRGRVVLDSVVRQGLEAARSMVESAAMA